MSKINQKHVESKSKSMSKVNQKHVACIQLENVSDMISTLTYVDMKLKSTFVNFATCYDQSMTIAY